MAKAKKIVIEGKGTVILRTTLLVPDDEVEELLSDYDSVVFQIEESDVVRIEDIELISLKVDGIETDVG